MALDIVGPANAPNSTTIRPGDTRVFGASDTWVKDCSSPSANDGTKIQAGWLNGIIAQLRNAIRGNGQTGAAADVVTQDNADDNMLLKAIQHIFQRNQPAYAIDTGSANALVVALSPAAAEYKDGMRIDVKAATTNTGATTINVNGLGAKQVRRRGGTDQLLAFDIIAGAVQTYKYDGTNFQLEGAFVRPQLTANYDLYVNGSIGNDANDGTANVTGKAVATLQRAINIAFSYAPSPFAITIHVADGTYAPLATPAYAGPNIILDGNATTPANVVVQNPSGTAHCVWLTGPNTMTAKNLTVVNLGTQAAGGFVATGSGATLNTQNTRSGNVSTGAVFEAYGGANVNVNGNHVFTAATTEWFWGMLGGVVSIATGITLSTTGNHGATTTALAQFGGIVNMNPPNATITLGGTFTGFRYSAIMNGVINVNGAGANYFPGGAAGSTATGGQYA